MNPLIEAFLTFFAAVGFFGGIIHFVRVRLLEIGSRKEIITALSVMTVSAIVLILLVIF